MKTTEGDTTRARVAAIAGEVARHAITECQHDPADLNDALAGLAGELAALRTETADQFEAELRRLVGVLVAHARLRRQALGGPVAAGNA